MIRVFVLLLIGGFVAAAYGKPTKEDVERIFSSSNSDNCIISLCHNGTSVNEKRLKDIVKNNREFLPLFGTVVNVTATVNFDNRDPTEKKVSKQNMCKTKRMTMFPTTEFAVNGEMKNIVNVKGYRQMLQFDVCAEDSQCYAKNRYLPEGVTSSCETQLIDIRLVVFENDSLKLEYFPIPAGCSCMYTKPYIFK